MSTLARLVATCCVLSLVAAAQAAIPTFQDLMDPSVFPEAQFGMKVESAAVQDGVVRIVTTGAEIAVDPKTGVIVLGQRIGQKREVAALRIGKPLSGVKITHQGEGFARVTVDQPKMTLRVNGDSLVLLQSHEPLKISVERKIVPAWHASWKANHLLVDELGGFALYCSDVADDGFAPFGSELAHYDLPANGVLGAGVCPPKPYDWDRSFRDHVVWHWSSQLAYPPDAKLQSWKDDGNIVLLQSEVLLWKDWNLDFVPRLGTAEFERVRNTLHDQGMRLIVYTSPFYFLKGTSQEKQAVNDKPGVCPGAIANGENMPLFLDAIRRVMRDLKPDGLYFDGQYIENPAALYALARESRRVVGEKGLLEWHSTAELGPWGSRMYMPHADAYTDFQLRGEGQDAIYDDFDYLRFFVSGYNVSNAVGVLCNNSGKPMTRPMLESLWNANVRLHTIVGNPARDIIQKEHRPHLTPQYQADVDREVLRRQERVPEKFATAEAFERGPTWKEPPLFAAEFDAMPAGETLVSEANPKDALRIQDGCLHLQAKASTYAFVRIPLNRHVTGFVVKVRQGSDQGASWGPAAMVRWANGGSIRVGSRSDGVQADVFGDQRLGPAQDPQAWVWLRARWNGTECLAEISRDGVNYQRFATYHRLIGKDVATELLIGKAPFHGQAKDYDVAGPIGECDIDFVRVYGSP